MPKLVRALREQNDSFQNIMDKVKTEVVDELKKLGREMQVGRSIGNLLRWWALPSKTNAHVLPLLP